MVGSPNAIRINKRRAATRREIVDAAWAIARANGLAGLTLREVAARVDMQAPSLYSHFSSKNAIYDAMFEDAWRTYLEHVDATRSTLPRAPRARLQAMARDYVEFAVADLARHQIMDVRTIPDFTPSDAAYAASLACYSALRHELAAIGITRAADLDIYTALLSGVIAQQLANDPGGDRWLRLLPRTIDMYADAVGVPTQRARRAQKGAVR